MAKRKKNSDPFAKREAKKYQHPIASREYILEQVSNLGRPVRLTELVDALGIAYDDEETFIALKRRLKAMVRDGQLVQNRKSAFGLPEKMDLIKGRVSANSGGFGFLIPEDGSEDLFLSSGQMKAVFDGDIVLAKVSGVDHRGRKEGRVEEILERHTHEVVGRCFMESGVFFLEPDNKKIFQDIILIESEVKTKGAGEFVVVDIVQQPSYRSPPLGKISEVLGEHMAPGMEIDVAIRTHHLPFRWSDATEQELKKIKSRISKQDVNERVDLRARNFVTIDGEDARDFDDAVFCEQHKSGWYLWVAIADVAHYVKSGSALDIDALERGNSVYFPKRVIPMLPEHLSNGLCSLNPHEDRLTLVCKMDFNHQGELQCYRFMEACIHSRARLTYTEVADFLEQGKISDNIHEVVEDIVCFYALYQQLKVQRDKRGALNVESTESRFVINDNKKIEAIVPVHRNVAHMMIEEAMLAANVCAAKLLQGNDLPALYRVHDAPTEEKLTDLKEYLLPLGFKFSSGAHLAPRHFQEVIRFSQGRADQELINTIVLRSMQQAIYSAECRPHFGLAYEQYAHFTSPIRRYPDLIVHRALKYFIRNHSNSSLVEAVSSAKKMNRSDMLVKETELLERGQFLSFTERRADLATRDATDWLKCEFMLDKVGETYSGKITSVTGFGFFVVLDDVFVEGLVHISDLANDYYHYDERRHELVGEHSQTVYRLADKVHVQVSRVSLDDKKIEFILHETGDAHTASSKKKKQNKKAKQKPDSKNRAKSSSKSRQKRDKKSRAKS